MFWIWYIIMITISVMIFRKAIKIDLNSKTIKKTTNYIGITIKEEEVSGYVVNQFNVFGVIGMSICLLVPFLNILVSLVFFISIVNFYYKEGDIRNLVSKIFFVKETK